MITEITPYKLHYPKRLKKFFQSGLNYETYDKFIPNMQRAVVGNIPPEIIKLFDNNKKNNILKFQDCLSDITRYLRATYHKIKCRPDFEYFDKNYRPSQSLKNLAADGQVVFNNILKRLPIKLRSEIEFAGHGSYGNVFKISLFDKDNKKIMHDKALKVYHSIQEYVKTEKTMHNNYAEANFWTYLKFWAGHSLDKSQFTKHYISDLKSGYALTEFIDENIPATKSLIHFVKQLHLNSKDAISNLPIRGKIFDVGGFAKDNDFIDDKIVLRYFKKLANRNPEKDLIPYMEQLQTKINNPKTPHRNKIQKALELFKQEFGIT